MDERLIKLFTNGLKELQEENTLSRRVAIVKWARQFGNDLLIATESGDSVREVVEKTVSTLKTGAAALADVLQLSGAGGSLTDETIEKSTFSSHPVAEKPKEPNKQPNPIPDLTDNTPELSADSEPQNPPKRQTCDEERNDLTDLETELDTVPEPLTPGKFILVGSRVRIRTLSTEEEDRFMIGDDETEDDVLQ